MAPDLENKLDGVFDLGFSDAMISMTLSLGTPVQLAISTKGGLLMPPSATGILGDVLNGLTGMRLEVSPTLTFPRALCLTLSVCSAPDTDPQANWAIVDKAENKGMGLFLTLRWSPRSTYAQVGVTTNCVKFFCGHGGS